MGRGESPRAEGEAATQGATVGSGSSCGSRGSEPCWPPHTAPLCPPTAPVFNQKLRVFEQGGRRRQTCLLGQPPWAAAVLPGGSLGLSAHTHLGWAVSAGPPWPRWVSLDLVPKGLWSGSSPQPPCSPPEPGGWLCSDCLGSAVRGSAVHSCPGLGCPAMDSGFWERHLLEKEAGPFLLGVK